MTMKPSTRGILIGASLLGSLSFMPSGAAHAASQSGQTTLTIKLPDYMVLSYFSSLDLELTKTGTKLGAVGASKTSALGAPAGLAKDMELGAGSLAADGFSAYDLNDKDNIVTLSNAWAITGLSPSGYAAVSIKGDSGSAKGNTLTNTEQGTDKHTGVKSTIAVDYAVSSSGYGNTGYTDEKLEVPLNGGYGGSATVGDIMLKLNFANTRSSGEHKGSFWVTAETI